MRAKYGPFCSRPLAAKIIASDAAYFAAQVVYQRCSASAAMVAIVKVGVDVVMCAVSVDVGGAVSVDVVMCAVSVDVVMCAVSVDVGMCAIAKGIAILRSPIIAILRSPIIAILRSPIIAILRSPIIAIFHSGAGV
jgi:hypothetical protein